jgi:hypothetical protein
MTAGHEGSLHCSKMKAGTGVLYPTLRSTDALYTSCLCVGPQHVGLTSRGPGNTVVELCDAVEISVQSWGSGLTKHFESATSVAGVLIPPKTSRWAST